MSNLIKIQQKTRFYAQVEKATQSFLKKQVKPGQTIIRETIMGHWRMGEFLAGVRDDLKRRPGQVGFFVQWAELEIGLSSSSVYRHIEFFEGYPNLPEHAEGAAFAATMEALLALPKDSEIRETALELASTGDFKTKADALALIEAQRPAPPTSSDEFAAESEPSPEAESEPASDAPKVSDPTPLEDDEFADEDPFADEVDDTDEDAITWISLQDERPALAEWVETALMEDGETVSVRRGYVEAETDEGWAYMQEMMQAPITEKWPITHFRRLPEDEIPEEVDELESSDVSPPEPEPTIEEKIRTSPLGQALSLFGHQGFKFVESAMDQEDYWKKISAIKAIAGQLRHRTNATALVLAPVARFAHWSDWEGCSACKGSGRFGERKDPCETCKTWGFVIIPGTGVSADVVREHAESLASESV